MRHLKNLNLTTMMAASLLLTTGVSSLNNLTQGNIVNTAYAAETLKNGTKVVVTGRVNFRKKATTNSDVICKIPKGTELTVKDSTKSFAKVTYNNQTGWVSLKYIDQGAINITDRTVSINSNDVNARSGPGLSYSVRKKYNKGDKVKITHSKIADGYTWFKTSEGYWIASKYTSDINTTSSSSSSSSKVNTTNAKSGGRVQILGQIRGSSNPGEAANSKGILLKKNFVYQYLKTAKVNGMTWYQVKALASDRTGWVPQNYAKEVTSMTNIGKKESVLVAYGTSFFKTSACNEEVPDSWVAPGTRLTVTSATTTTVKVKFKKLTGHTRVGYVNKGSLQFDSKGFRNANTANPRAAIRDALIEMVDEKMAINSYKKLSSTSIGEPNLVEMNVSIDEQEPYYINQYVVDVTVNDNGEEKVETLRFDPEDTDILKDVMSNKEVTFYLDEDEETKGILPMYIVKTEIGNVQNSTESDEEVIRRLAKDYVEIARMNGIEMEDFTEKEIKDILGK